MSQCARRWILLNVGLALLALGVFCFTRLALVETSGTFCLFKSLFHLYCPFCGGTRTAAALFRLDLLTALRSNAFLTLVAFLLSVYDLRILCALIQKRPHPFSLSPRLLWGLLFLMIFFFLFRNALLLFGVDPLGDFL